MVLLAEKLGRSLKFHSRLEIHHQNSQASSASLHDFRYKTLNFLSQILLKPGKGSELLSLAWFHNCFELIHVTNRAFAKLVVEIDYPMSQWGGQATEEYLSYSLNLLDMLNSITSSVSHLNQAKISIFHALSLIENSPTSAAKYLKKIQGRNLGKDFKVEGSTGIEERPGSDQKECVILQALMVLKKIGFLALGLVVSGLCSDAKPYLEIRKFPGGFDDPLKKVLDSGFGKEMTEIQGPVEEVKEVNLAAERLSAILSTGRCGEAVGELKERLEVLENSIQGLEKQANNLFSEVLATRNKLLDNIRFIGHNP
ncbi:hypothetical protein Pfo_005516 [Paulownia fortunei]|nr:hypothetical protein Pfo_005516 [Paulownia fortunei]